MYGIKVGPPDTRDVRQSIRRPEPFIERPSGFAPPIGPRGFATMRTLLRLMLPLAAFGTGVDGPPPQARTVKDFKLEVALKGAGETPLSSATIVVAAGVAYQFVTAAKEEVQVVDVGRSLVQLVDLRRKVWTEVSAADLHAGLERLRASIGKAADRRDASGSRADRLAASMSRDLAATTFTTTFDPDARRLKLSNASVEVDALGEPEPDAARLSYVRDLLALTAELSAYRDPANIPPFARLAAVDGLARGHALRPVEVSLLYRLSGPPRRLKWTYRVVPDLTGREREAVDLVVRLRASAPFLPYRQYQPRAAGE